LANSTVNKRCLAGGQYCAARSCGKTRPDYAARLEDDITAALFPSPERARRLNAAYREIVLEQSYAKTATR